MKLRHEHRELGDWYSEEREFDIVDAVMLTVVLGVIILAIEYTGLADQIINYFNA